jgi:penicillin V acylase-like amidase (Ntn superfamily)
MMKKLISLIFCCLFISCITPPAAQACSTFCLDHNSQPVFGKNYDWDVDDGLIIINKRNVLKTSAAAESSISWTSKYGSVTFNQYGREFAHGGINEAGLVVELMWLSETIYPSPDSRSGLDCLQWVQYQLDNFSTVAEVIASDSQIRIVSNSAPLHYLVCDNTGTCASIEFLEGKMVVHTGKTMSFKALTNSPYAQSVEFLKQHEGFGGTTPIGTTTSSLDRFARAANMLKNYEPTTSEGTREYAFDILKNVSAGARTKWSIVYDIESRRVYFRTFANPQIRYFELNTFDFSCNTSVKVLDINAEGSGNITNNFIEYTRQLNRNLIGNAYKKTDFLAGVSDEVLDQIADYPESIICQNP